MRDYYNTDTAPASYSTETTQLEYSLKPSHHHYLQQELHQRHDTAKIYQDEFQVSNSSCGVDDDSLPFTERSS
jgi:hypothetical protein